MQHNIYSQYFNFYILLRIELTKMAMASDFDKSKSEYKATSFEVIPFCTSCIIKKMSVQSYSLTAVDGISYIAIVMRQRRELIEPTLKEEFCPC